MCNFEFKINIPKRYSMGLDKSIPEFIGHDTHYRLIITSQKDVASPIIKWEMPMSKRVISIILKDNSITYSKEDFDILLSETHKFDRLLISNFCMRYMEILLYSCNDGFVICKPVLKYLAETYKDEQITNYIIQIKKMIEREDKILV